MSTDNVTPIGSGKKKPSMDELGEKVVIAKSIVQAVIAAHNSGGLDDENYDLSYPLWQVVRLLEQVSEQLPD